MRFPRSPMACGAGMRDRRRTTVIQKAEHGIMVVRLDSLTSGA
jgi:hypothetical protein